MGIELSNVKATAPAQKIRNPRHKPHSANPVLKKKAVLPKWEKNEKE